MMKASSIQERISKQIRKSPAGEAFVIADFLDLGGDAAIRKALCRLEAEGLIRRVLRGVYDRPARNEFLGETIEPDPMRVALAIARSAGWSVVPSGDAALNLLGLSAQVPSVWRFASDGPYREYRYGNVTIQFVHSANRNISGLSPKTSLVIQAIKAIGKDKISQKVRDSLRNVLSEQERARMLSETTHSTSWVYHVIEDICRGTNETPR